MQLREMPRYQWLFVGSTYLTPPGSPSFYRDIRPISTVQQGTHFLIQKIYDQ